VTISNNPKRVCMNDFLGRTTCGLWFGHDLDWMWLGVDTIMTGMEWHYYYKHELNSTRRCSGKCLHCRVVRLFAIFDIVYE
jgi:hypothetical protein